MEYHSFLLSFKVPTVSNKLLEFPSPYGVSFILTFIIYTYTIIFQVLFPSPYGVSFILTEKVEHVKDLEEIKFPSPYGVSFILTCFIWHLYLHYTLVSVSLWSIIHSYLFYYTQWIFFNQTSFRLLMEYHSFLRI